MSTYMLREDAARFLCVSVRALEAWASKGTGPRYRKHGRRAVYLQADLETWSEQQARANTSESGPTNSPHRPSSRACLRESGPAVASVAAGPDAGGGR